MFIYLSGAQEAMSAIVALIAGHRDGHGWAVNSGLPDFTQDFSFDPADPVFVCIGFGHTRKGNQPAEVSCGNKAIVR
jgi:hypothetical protein